MLSTIAGGEFVACWVAWVLAFVRARRRAAAPSTAARAPASRWGIVLQGVGFALVFVHVRPAGMEKSTASLVASMVLGPASVWVAWAAVGHLGKQWRFEAALRDDHELVRTGPYRWVRHPIYASMFGLLSAAGACWAWWPLFLAGAVAFAAGTEVRVRAEDHLLAGRFGDAFAAYRAAVPAYVPLVR